MAAVSIDEMRNDRPAMWSRASVCLPHLRALVPENGLDVAIVGVLTAALNRATEILDLSAEPVVIDRLISGDNHIIALADGDEKVGGVEGLDGNKIGGYNEESVVVQAEDEVVVHSGVDQAEFVFLTCLHVGDGVGACGTCEGVRLGVVEKEGGREKLPSGLTIVLLMSPLSATVRGTPKV